MRAVLEIEVYEFFAKAFQLLYNDRVTAKDMPGRPLAGMARRFKGFSKIRVLDFSKLLPGPYATQALVEMGCRVTRVELPHFQDISREIPPKIEGVGALYWLINQGKRELRFDFRTPAGRKRMETLIRSSDVLMEGFRPGLMDRIGLGYAAVKKLNSKLVYCSLSGYSPSGPWAKTAGHDINFMAASGFLGLGNSEGRVAYPAAQLADVAGSLGALSGILAALVERAFTGKGRHVQVAITDVLHSMLSIPLAELKATGKDAKPGKEWWSGGSHPFYGLYDTKDGRKMAVGALEPKFSIALMDVLGLSNLRGTAVKEALRRMFAEKTMLEWEKIFAGKDVCVTPVYTLGEAQARL